MFLNDNMRARSSNVANVVALLKGRQPTRKGESGLPEVTEEPQRRTVSQQPPQDKPRAALRSGGSSRKESALIRALKEFSFVPSERILRKMLYYYRGYENYFDFTKHMRFVDSQERLERADGESPERPWSVISGLILNSAPKDFNEAISNTKNNFITTSPPRKSSKNKKKRIYVPGSSGNATTSGKQRPGTLEGGFEEGARGKGARVGTDA